MFLYLVMHWEPFPVSEYGGVHIVIARNRVEAAKLLHRDSTRYTFEDVLLEVRKADAFEVVEATSPKVVMSFVT
jgi:hypothetical protein